MTNLYEWTNDFDGKNQKMIAVGKDEKSAKVYSVHKGYRMLQDRKFIDYLRGFGVFGYKKTETTFAKVNKRFGPAMTNIFTWTDSEKGEMVAVGSDHLFEKVYFVRDGYRELRKPTLGQLLKFMAVDEDTYKGPFRKKVSDIQKEYGPVRKPGKRTRAR